MGGNDNFDIDEKDSGFEAEVTPSSYSDGDDNFDVVEKDSGFEAEVTPLSHSDGDDNFNVVEKEPCFEAEVTPSTTVSFSPQELYCSFIPPKSHTTTTTNSNRNPTKNQKKKQKRRQRKKNTSTQGKKSNKPRVHFSCVKIRTFLRTFGDSVVPGHGGWPLGMKLDDYKDHDQVPLEEYETNKQKLLRERWKVIQSTCSTPSTKNNIKILEIDDEIIHLIESIDDYETRQWDYRNKVKNPLFGLVSEKKRQALFLEGSEGNLEGRNQPLLRSQSLKLDNNDTRRTRSHSMGSNNHSQGMLSNYNFNEEFNQSLVHHVRNELEQLRFERNKSGSTGCNCSKLIVYIPPKDGSGGKKSKHRRLKPSKLITELKKRHLYGPSVASSSREKKEKILQKAVEKEPCCRDEDCFCIRNGIVCQADSCSCWLVRKNSSSSNHSLSSADIQRRCGNQIEVTDMETINEYRIKIINEKKQHP